MATYEDFVNELFDKESTDKIANDSPDNAAAIYCAIFSHAKDTVRIACEKMDKEVFDRECVSNAIRTALNRGVNLFISMHKSVADQSRSMDVIRELHNMASKNPNSGIGQIRFFVGAQFTANGTPVNFSVMDMNGYRYEMNADRISASACANDQQFAKQLAEVFDTSLGIQQAETL